MFSITQIHGPGPIHGANANAGNQVLLHEIKHHFMSAGTFHTWLTVPSVLKVHNGRLCLEVQGRQNGEDKTRNVHFQNYGMSQIRESLKLGTMQLPDLPSATRIAINMHTGTAVFHFNNTAYLLHTATNVSPSLKKFIRAALPNNTVAQLIPSPDGMRNTSRLRGQAVANEPWLNHLPTELMAGHVQPEMSVSSLANTSSANLQHRLQLQPDLDRWENMCFAGTKVIHDDDGNQVLGEDGLPVRSHPPVFDWNGEPVFDLANRQVFRHGLDVPGYEHYFDRSPNQYPPVMGRHSQNIIGANGQPVLQMPKLNTAFFTDALNMLVSRPTSPAQKQAALRALITEFSSSQPAGYIWQYSIVGNTMRVTLPAELQAALTSEHQEIRNWALECLMVVKHVYTVAQPQLMALFDSALAQRLCVTQHGQHTALDGYAPTTANATGVTIGEYHKTMLLSPDTNILGLANWMTQWIALTHGINNTSIRGLNNANSPHVFPPAPPPAGGQQPAAGQNRVDVPAVYDSWIAGRNFDDQRKNIRQLSDIMHAYTTAPAHIPLAPVPIPPDEHARGFAQYLVRNLAGMPRAHIERILYSEALLLHHDNFYSHQRAPFIEELRKPTPSGSAIPVDIVNNVSSRMRTAVRNDWAIQQFWQNVNQGQRSRQVQHDVGKALIRFAQASNVDLVSIVEVVGLGGAPQHTQQYQQAWQRQQDLLQAFINSYRGSGGQVDIAANTANTTALMTWLRTSLTTANAPR